jgi:hypothetical protein
VELLPKHLKRTALFLASCTRLHANKAYRKLETRVVKRLASTDKFPGFLVAAIQSSASDCVRANGQCSINLIHLCCTLMKCHSTDDAPEWNSSLNQIVLSLFENVASVTESKRAAAGKQLSKALTAKPCFFKPLVDLATAESAKGEAPRFEAIQWLIFHSRKLDDYEAVYKPLFTQMYVRDMLSSKSAVPVQVQMRFSPLLESFSHSDMTDQVQELIVQQVEQNAEAIGAVAVLTEYFKIDLSRYATDTFMPMVLAQLKSTDEHCQLCALKLLQNVVSKSDDVDVIVAIAAQVAAEMKGSASQVAHKKCLIRAFDAIREGVTSRSLSAVSPIADIALDALLQFASKEKVEEAKHPCVQALAQWYCLADKPDGKYFDLLLKGVESKDKNTRQVFLSALLLISSSAAFDEKAMGALDVLSALATEADKKTMAASASAPLDAVAAMAILMKTQCTNMEAGTKLKDSKMHKLFSKKSSFLFHLSLLQVKPADSFNAMSISKTYGLPPPARSSETTILVGLAESFALAATHQHTKALILEHSFFASPEVEEGQTAPAKPKTPPALCAGLVELLLHPLYHVRRAAIKSARDIQSSTKELVYPLLIALRNRLAGMKRPGHRTILVNALNALVPESADTELLPIVLLLVHHPFLNTRTKKSWCSDTYNAQWHTLCDCFGGVDEVSENLGDASLSGQVQQVLLADTALLSTNVCEQEAAWSAVASLLELPGEGGQSVVVNGVFTEVLGLLGQTELTSLSAKDIGIWSTPEGELYVEGGRSGYNAAAGSSANVRRMRTGKRGGLYSAEDEAWEDEVRAELEAKKAKEVTTKKPAAAKAVVKKKKKGEEEPLFPLDKKKKGGKAKAAKSKPSGGAKAGSKKMAPPVKESREEKEKRERLEQESETRTRVGDLINSAEKWLQVLMASAAAVPLVLNAQLPMILPAVLKLLDSQSDVVKECAYDCLKKLVDTIDPCIQDIAADIAAALRVALTKPADLKNYIGLLERLFEDLVPVCSLAEQEFGAMPLPAASFHVLFPLCKAVCLATDLPADIYSGAFGVMGMHAAVKEYSDEDLPLLRKLRRPMIESALHLLATSPKMEPAPDRVLAGLVDGPKLSVAEWGPILGDAGLLNANTHVRFAVLRSLMLIVSRGAKLPMATNLLLSSRVWLSQYDDDEQNQKVATTLWDHTDAELSKLYATPLMALLSHAEEHVRNAAARALANALVEHPGTSNAFLQKLFKVANGGSQDGKVVVPEVGADGFPLSPSEIERLRWQMEEEMATKLVPPRLGTAATLKMIGEEKALEASPEADLACIFQFLVDVGMVTSNDVVRAAMSAGGMALIDSYGAEYMDMLLPLFEKYMAAAESPTATDAEWYASDWRKQGLVVFLGTMAKHLDKDDSRVPTAINTLMAALGTPSEAVQQSVATCLAPLIPAVREQAPALLAKLLEQTIQGETYGDRRGGAYGVSAVIKGLGIVALKKNNIIPQLQDACKGKGGNPRQGALFAFECLSLRLGLLFEPYVIDIIPILLKSFSDTSASVRSAADGTARAIMKKLSAHGVKLILPSLLTSLNDPQWRTKQAAIQLLGSMAYCAPRQLSSCLPQIVPKLTDAFTDTHPKVREAGKISLGDIASVVRNPEVAHLSPTLLAALSDPTEHTNRALQALQDTSFVHSIDPPSLALIVPILNRGLRERGTDVKKKAALIVGNMCSMIR